MSQIPSMSGVLEIKDDIAIIGLSCRFAQDACSPQKFWETLRAKRHTSTKVPADRFNVDSFYNADNSRHETMNVQGGHFISQPIDKFDAPFFSIAAADAECMDPQQRMLLEVSYHALENAGITFDACVGSTTSVYTGSFTQDYKDVMFGDHEQDHRYAASGTARCMDANRLSWFYDFKGPSVPIDTACSSSLTALHLACEDLRHNRASMSLVGGSNLIFHPSPMSMMTAMGFLSPDARCFSFDSRANGYARGEGVGVLVLKRVLDAVRDGNTIRAVIRATGTSSDGRTPGITVPSKASQQSLIETTFQKANLHMDNVRYFEAHGTGTAIGDPIEAHAIGHAFARSRSTTDPIYIGAVKSNIGHTEGASGIAGIIKTVLVLETGIIPPNCGMDRLNPKINATELFLKFPQTEITWPSKGLRRACVNSFGFGGSNAIAVLDDARNYCLVNGIEARLRSLRAANVLVAQPGDQLPADGIHSKSRLLCWSSHDEGGLERFAKGIASYIEKSDQSEQFAEDLFFTLNHCRSTFQWRSYAVASSLSDLQRKLELPTRHVRKVVEPQATFVFTGQGSQYTGMGRDLCALPQFASSISECDTILRQIGARWSLTETLSCAVQHSNADDPSVSQPLCTALQIALCDLFFHFNIQPKMVIGHSSGEIAAAYCAGAISKEEALQIAFHRGSVCSDLAQNHKLSMMVVGSSVEEIRHHLQIQQDTYGSCDVDIACYNSHRSITLSGDASHINRLEEVLTGLGLFARVLNIPCAYHSRFMKKVSESYKQRLAACKTFGQPWKFSPQSPTLISSVTTRTMNLSDLRHADYWVHNLLRPVEFSNALSQLNLVGSRVTTRTLGVKNLSGAAVISDIIELGPHASLKAPIKQILESSNSSDTVEYHSALRKGVHAVESLLSCVGALFSRGFRPDLSRTNNLSYADRSLLTDLPSYPFNHTQSYWKEGRVSREYRTRVHARHSLLGVTHIDWNPLLPGWRQSLVLSRLPWLRDHKIHNRIIFPGSAMLVMVLEAYLQVAAHHRWNLDFGLEVSDVDFHFAMHFKEGQDLLECQLVFVPQGTSTKTGSSKIFEFRLYAVQDAFRECCRGIIKSSEVVPQPNLDQAHARLEDDVYPSYQGARVLKKDLYDRFPLGPCFQTLNSMLAKENGIGSATVDTFENTSIFQEGVEDDYIIHPCTLDGVFQNFFPAMFKSHPDIEWAIPTKIHRIWLNIKGLEQDKSRSHFRTQSALSRLDTLLFESSIAAMCPSRNNLLVLIDALHAKVISTRSVTALDTSRRDRLCARVLHIPDIQLNAGASLGRAYSEVQELTRSALHVQTLDGVLTWIISDLLEWSSSNPLDNISTPNHLVNYRSWLKRRASRPSLDPRVRLIHKNLIEQPHLRSSLVAQTLAQNMESKFLITIASSLKDVLTGSKDPLELIFGGPLIERYYQEMLSRGRCVSQLKQYFTWMCLKDPQMTILEIGAGTGSFTQACLESMTLDGRTLYQQYDFTDLSNTFLTRAKTQFSDFGEKMCFKIFDVDKDPEQQGLASGHYDLIIAADVMHCASNLDRSLSYIRKLLKSNGKFVMLEITNPESLRAPMVFGLLKDWWVPHALSEHLSPCMTPHSWHRSLLSNGFSGLDQLLSDYDDPTIQENSVIISTAVRAATRGQTPYPKFLFGVDHEDKAQVTTAQRLRSHLSQLCEQSTVLSLSELVNDQLGLERSTVFVLFELSKPFLTNMSRDEFDQLQKLLLNAEHIVWVTAALRLDSSLPHYRAVDGLRRSLISERPALRFETIHIDARDTSFEALNRVATSILVEADTRSAFSTVETELEIDHGLIMTSRLVHSASISEIASAAASKQETAQKEISEQVTLRDEMDLPLAEIVLTSMGSTTRKKSLTSKMEGRFCALGQIRSAEGATHLTRGDSVVLFGISTGARHNQCRLHQIFRVRSHDMLSSIPVRLMDAMMACHIFLNDANIEPHQTVMIFRPSERFLFTLMPIAARSQARVVFLVGAEAALPERTEMRGAVADNVRVVPVHTASLVLPLLCPAGANIMVSCRAGLSSELPVDSLAYGGKYLDLNEGNDFSDIKRLIQSRGAIYSRPDLFSLEQSSPTKLKMLLQTTVRLFEDGVFTHEFQSPGNQEAEVTQPAASLEAKPELQQPPVQNIFASTATYVLAGGFGGLGRSLSRWMVDRGAKNLLILSRSGPVSLEAKELLADLKDKDVRVLALSCDISVKAQLQRALETCHKCMPPIKGCIQTTMVLKDSIFANMSFANWVASTAPKVQGSWNLHEALPRNLDIFILLSSISGIMGGMGQANYAAGNCFEDALARHRIAMGENAAVIDLGMMVDEGVVASDRGMLARLRRMGFYMDTTQPMLYAILENFIRNPPSRENLDHCQVAIGIELPHHLQEKGLAVPRFMQEPRFSTFHLQAPTAHQISATMSEAKDYTALLRSAGSIENASGRIFEWFALKISSAFGVEFAAILRSHALVEYGIDSLLAIEIRNWFSEKVGASLTVFELLGDQNVGTLCDLAAQRSTFVEVK